MRALLSEAVGGPETLRLRDVPLPEPGPGQVRIRVAACGINFPDALIIEDRYQFRPERPFAPGAEVSGFVDALGPGVTDLTVGDRVLAGEVCGGLAEQVLMPDGRCYRIPAAMPFDEAAAFLMTYGTSHHALKDRGKVQPGETMLVMGAAGGVGLAAVELGKAMGVRVIGAVSSAEKAAVVRDRGADDVIVYPSGPLSREEGKAFGAAIREAAGGEIDIVYDPVGGSYAEPALRALAWDGRYLVVGFPAGIPSIPLNLPLLKGIHIIGVFWGSFIERFPERNRANVAELLDLYSQGLLHPLVSSRYPLARGGEAIAELSSRRAVGKLVVEISEGEG
ncbi:NADPH:quinone oxidoreductase family protein [Sphingosinithalassobacter portus]|uniref:NADPH:quinone oxidoreductase family protein n=1 Tax=Stakelama portus TaxID=2676234 RepID=UPI000D6E8F73|nr:NADPH:quinone oxidoreductase family protein [Sphingosinithalassobacter portus]